MTTPTTRAEVENEFHSMRINAHQFEGAVTQRCAELGIGEPSAPTENDEPIEARGELTEDEDVLDDDPDLEDDGD